MDIIELLSNMALELQDAETPSATAETISQYGRIAVDADEAGILLVQAKGRLETPAATGPLVDQAHQLQAKFDEGPCLDAIKGGDDTYLVTNTAADPRWPKWGPAAADLGFFSAIGASLETRARRIGSLNLYAHRADAFTKNDAETVKWLATHASVAMAAADERAGLRTALGNRTLIGQAEGVLMRALGINEDQAFAYLQRLSQHHNVKLAKIAEQIIENRDSIGDRGPQPDRTDLGEV
ncbi:MAG: GAF and ANTAR domain-containing protein [Aeromicrobium sp.]